MDLTKILETVVSNLPSNATININVAQPGAPIYNCIGGAQFIGNNPASSRRNKKETKETESPDAIVFDIDSEEDDDNDNEVSLESVVANQSGYVTSDEAQETAVASQETTVDIDALIDEAVDEKGLDLNDSASVKLWAAQNPTKLQEVLLLSEDEMEANDGVDDIYTCLKDAGWSKD